MKQRKASEVHNLTFTELNNAINKIKGNNDWTVSSGACVEPYDLFYLKDLGAFNFSSAEPSYWLATPVEYSYIDLMLVDPDGLILASDRETFGIQTVITLNSDIYKDGNIWRIK